MSATQCHRRWMLGLCLGLCAAGAAAAQQRVIYDDGLGAGFDNWSWASNSFAHTALVHSGSQAIAFEPDNWAGVYVHADAPVEFAGYAGLRFYVRGDAPAGQSLSIQFQLGNSQVWSAALASRISGGAIAASEWRQVDVAFGGAGAPAGYFDGLILQDASGGNQNTVYVDDIVLLAGTLPPPPGAVTLSVDTGSQRRSINPLIYSVNFGSDAQHAALRYPSRRWGGNAKTRYNWQVDVHNTASDYFYQNIADGDGVGLPDNSTANQFIASTLAQGGDPLITLPTIGWVPLDLREKRWGFSVARYGAQTLDECSYYGASPPFWCSADAGNGLCSSGTNCVGGRIVGNDPTDTSKAVAADYAADWVSHLRNRHGNGTVILFALDNEPMLWNSTHRDVHPQAPSYDEVWTRGRDTALAIKAIEPAAQVFGPVTWGWCDFFTSAADASLGNCFDGPDRQAHGGLGFVDWYLQQVCATAESSGVRPVDYLDLHYYPQGGVDGLDNDAVGGEAADVAARRLRSLGELYDPGYTSESWIGDTAYPIPRLLPRAREAIATHCPGLKLALTEYKWGPDDGLTGALAQAEALAIFGREGVDYASRWIAPDDGSLTEQAFRMFLNYDGNYSRVVGDSVAASSSDAQAITVYAVDQAGGPLLLLSFNHSLQARDLQLQIGNESAQRLDRYRLDANGLSLIADNLSASGSGLDLGSQPARSAELWVITRSESNRRVFADGFEARP